jgi:3-dehydroquinate synthase
MHFLHLKFPSRTPLSEISIHKQKFPLIVPDQLLTLSREYSRCAIISDSSVFSLYGKQLVGSLRRIGMSPLEIIVSPGEESKSLLSAQQCWRTLYKEGFNQNSCILSLGGSTILDIAGFVAATYMRGIDIIHIPTTLRGMVGGAIGGRTAINFAEKRDMLGVFHQPRFVWIFPDLLNTLPERQFRAGLAEVIKYGVIKNPLLFDYLETHLEAILLRDPEHLYTIIESSCFVKSEIVQQDLPDRAILEWGHTFTHAIETATNYRQYLHGEAVAIGMSCAAQISHLLGFSNRELTNRQNTLSERAGLPLKLPNISSENLLKIIEEQTKNKSGCISLVVAEKIGKAFKVPNVDKMKIKEMLELSAKGCLPNSIE